MVSINLLSLANVTLSYGWGEMGIMYIYIYF